MLTDKDIITAKPVYGEFNLKWLLIKEMELEKANEAIRVLTDTVMTLKQKHSPDGGWCRDTLLDFLHPQYRLLQKIEGTYVVAVSPLDEYCVLLIPSK